MGERVYLGNNSFFTPEQIQARNDGDDEKADALTKNVSLVLNTGVFEKTAMLEIKDCKGREWDLALNRDQIKEMLLAVF